MNLKHRSLTDKVQQNNIINSLTKLIFIVVASLIVYIPAMQGGFVWDDDFYVTGNPLLAAPDGLYRIWFSKDSPSQYFPLVYTTFRFERKIWGLNPHGYHITNILLHTINSLLLWRLLYQMNIGGAWLAASIFALHPVNVESVAWITERKNVLMMFFSLLSLSAWFRFVDSQHQSKCPWVFYAFSLLLYALAIFSKTTACTLPAAIVVLLWLKYIPIDFKRWLQIAPYVLFGAAMGILTIWWEWYHQGTDRLNLGINPIESTLIASRALWFYAGKLVWPVNLTFSYPKWKIDAADLFQYGWLLACLITALGIWYWRDKLGRGVISAIIFFVATISPMLGFLSLYTFRYTYVADHYQYMASIGPISLIAGLGCRLRERLNDFGKGILTTVAAFVLVALGTLTWHQCHIYKNPETLWRDTIRKNQDSWMAYNNLGRWLKSQGRLNEAVNCYHQALKIKPNHDNAYFNLGIAYDKLGRYDEAIEAYKQTIKIQPAYTEAHFNLGISYSRLNRYSDAVEAFKQAINIKPAYSEAYCNLGVTYGKLGRYTEAIKACKQAINIRPDYAEAHLNLGIAHFATGDRKSALGEYKILKMLNTEDANNLFNIIQQ